MTGAILDVTEWWVIPTASDDDSYCRRSGRAASAWRQAVENPKADLRKNDDLDDFFAQPIAPPPPPATDLRKNDLLDAFFG